VINPSNEILTLEISAPIDEFASHFVDIMKNKKPTIAAGLLNTIDYCFENAIENHSHITKISFLDRPKVPYTSDDDTLRIEEYIQRGSCAFNRYKIKYDSIKDDSIESIAFVLPEYLLLEDHSDILTANLKKFHPVILPPVLAPSHKKFYVKKKTLKTKAQFFIEFVRIVVTRPALVRIRDLLPANFFLLYSSQLGGRKQFVQRDNIISQEKLPYPIVLYPGTIGTFIGFKKRMDDKEIYFCSCMKEALRNCIKISLLESQNQKDSYKILYHAIPFEFTQILLSYGNESPENIFKHFLFADSICHECNKIVPAYYYAMPWTEFYKSYGWYVEKRFYEYGIYAHGLYYGTIYTKILLKDKCPKYILDLCEIDPEDIARKIYETRKEYEKSEKTFDDFFIKLEKESINFQRIIRDAVENEVRNKFGYRRKGEEWIGETILFYEIKQAFPNVDVIHHGRPEWLGKQHFDIWIPEWKIAIEYQGEQHYKPVSVFGGEKGFIKNLERDKRKEDLCDENGVQLLLIDGGYNLSDIIKAIEERRR
jgi:hypothetical protein